MDRKNTIFVIAIMMALVVLWQPTYFFILEKLGYDTQALRHPLPTTQPNEPPTTAPTTASSAGTTQSAPTRTVAPVIAAVPASQPSRTILGSPVNNDKTYRLAASIVAQGAGIDSVILNEFKKSVSGLDPYVYQQPYEKFETISRALATRSVTIDGQAIDVSSIPWQMISSSQRAVTFALDVNGPDGPLARITKSFEVFPASDAENGSGYEMLVTQGVQNLTSKPQDISVLFNGPTTPPRELDRGSDRMIIGGYLNGSDVYVTQNYVESFGEKQVTKDYTVADKNNYALLWAGTASVYFDALIRPQPARSDQFSPAYIEKVEARSLNPAEPNSQLHLVNVTFATKPQIVPPGENFSFAARAFFGPKQRTLLTNSYYAKLPRAYNSTLVITSGLCGVCTFSWLIEALVWLLNVLHKILFQDWGLAIIGLVVIVRIILHPITKKSQENMAHMSKFGPEIEKLKAKYKDDTAELNKAMMQFYKEHGATPILGCLPMLLQMPIWIALWQALQTTFELRHAGFLRFGWAHLTWIKDLSQPDHLIAFEHPYSLLGIIPISGLNILPILMGIVFFVQQKYFTPKPPTMTPEQESQQKIMQWMTGLLFPLMLYAGPSGLNLYILTSTFFGVIESKVIRDHIKEREEAEKEGKVMVDVGKKFRGGKAGGGGFEKPKPQGRFAGWVASLQEKAEQMQREQNRKRR